MTYTGSVKDAVSRNELYDLLKEQRDGLTKTFNEKFDDLNSKISELREKIIQKDRTISEQEEKIIQKDRTISELREKIIQKDRTIAEKEKTLAEKVKTIAEKEKTLGEKEKTIGEKEKTLAEKVKTIAEKEKTLGEKEETLGEKEETLGAKEKTIGEKEIKESNYRNLIRDYTNLLNAKDKIFTPFYFDSGEKSFKPKPYEKRIEKIASWLSKNPNINLILYGYCDHYGPIEKNKGLGKERAMFVKGLIEKQWEQISNEKSNQISNRLEIKSIGRTKDFDPERVSVNRQVMFEFNVVERAGSESSNNTDNNNSDNSQER